VNVPTIPFAADRLASRGSILGADFNLIRAAR